MSANRFLSTLATIATLGSTAGAEAQTLYQTFAMPANLDVWQSYLVPLQGALPGGSGVWRVAATDADIGSPFGAPASDAQLKAVLGNLGALEIGGVLTNGSNPPVIYPGGFGLDNPNLAGLASESFTSFTPAWGTTVNRAPGIGIGWSISGGNPGGFANASQPSTTAALLTFLAPVGFLGDKSAAFGNSLTFDLKDFPNNTFPASTPSYSYGIAILTAAVPEPATWLLMLAGVVVAVGRTQVRWPSGRSRREPSVDRPFAAK